MNMTRVHPVTISVKSLKLTFTQCTPEYIRSVCHGGCCSTTSHHQCLVAVMPHEREAFLRMGYQIRDGFLQPRHGETECPFKDTTGLCKLHGTPLKPFGFIAAPFTLTHKDTLIISNRYKVRKCFRDGTVPAYQAFQASLTLLFGTEETERIVSCFEADVKDNFEAHMLMDSYQNLKHRQRLLTLAAGKIPRPDRR